MTPACVNASTYQRAPWLVAPDTLYAGNVRSDITRTFSTTICEMSLGVYGDQFPCNPSIRTALRQTPEIKQFGQDLVGLLPETSGSIKLIIGDEIDSLSITHRFASDTVLSRATVDTFKGIVNPWRKYLAEHHLKGLNKRLEYIFEDEPEISANQTAPDTCSFSAMLAYLSAKPQLKTPSIGFNHDGSFSATWISGKKLRVSLSFIEPDSIRWVYIDARNETEKPITGAGTVTNEILNGVLNSYHAYDWMKI